MTRLPSLLTIAAIVCALTGQMQAQTPPPIIRAVLSAEQFDSTPPSNRPFVVRVAVPTGVTSIALRYGTARREGDKVLGIAERLDSLDRAATGLVRREELAFRLKELAPATEHVFEFLLRDGATQRETVQIIAVTKPVPRLDFKNHFDTDFGFLWAPDSDLRYVGAGTNVHFLFVPITDEEDPARFDGWDHVFKRFSVFAGLSFVKLHSEAKVDHILNAGTPVVGIGLRPYVSNRARVFSLVRLNAGVMYFEQKDANPLIAEKRRKHAPFVALAGDFALKDVLGPLAALLGIIK